MLRGVVEFGFGLLLVLLLVLGLPKLISWFEQRQLDRP
jgi:hypothetical protein